MNWFENVLGKGWEVTPAGGLTGDAYFAKKKDKRLFLKRNSSPFLAVLSAEGIVPKLVWTKRMENGDVITAQEWMEGRELKPFEMQHHQVADILRKIHHSSELLHMLMRLGKKPVTSDDSFYEIKERIYSTELLKTYDDIQIALTYLERLLPTTREQRQVVCHGDLNHNNLLLTNKGHLYLIDWDNAIIADPVTDFGMVMKSYIPNKDWNEWLKKYGADNDEHLIERMYWYLLLDALHYFSWHSERNENEKKLERLKNIQELNAYIGSSILD
ncbi:thiamine kinase-like enzyme [Virgibacillus natechei]|uniref:Thiamine kinase-like enzyme n=1 Tax=Virgibacillus natechei TaxID=1216297 RepID=A0ABS4IDB6_9BACI|nr:thiamine kinase-like enzyme [Virgibacillus natechei]